MSGRGDDHILLRASAAGEGGGGGVLDTQRTGVPKFEFCLGVGV